MNRTFGLSVRCFAVDAFSRICPAAVALYGGPYGLPETKLENYNNFGEFDDDKWEGVKRSHMGNFFNCIESGQTPISDVVSVGNGTISCHLANIGLRLGRKLDWDPVTEDFRSD